MLSFVDIIDIRLQRLQKSKTRHLHGFQVRIGLFEAKVGKIRYQYPEYKEESKIWIIGVAVGGGILVTIIIVILIIYKRKSTEAERQYKKMQLQLDTLESNVRNECKQGVCIHVHRTVLHELLLLPTVVCIFIAKVTLWKIIRW